MGWALYGEIETVLYAESRYDLTLIEDAERRRCDVYVRARLTRRDLLDQEEQEQVLAEEYEGEMS